MSDKANKSSKLYVRVDDDLLDKIDHLCDVYKLDRSKLVRMLINSEYKMFDKVNDTD